MDLSPWARIDPREITFLWIDGYYGGVLSGFAIWQERLCYFECCDDTTDEWKYALHGLSAEDAAKALQENEEFKELHGNHNDMLPDGTRAGGVCKGTLQDSAAAGDAIAAAMTAGEWEPPYPYRDNPMVGWFIPKTF